MIEINGKRRLPKRTLLSGSLTPMGGVIFDNLCPPRLSNFQIFL